MVFVKLDNRGDIDTDTFDEAYDLVDEKIISLPKIDKQETALHIWGVAKNE